MKNPLNGSTKIVLTIIWLTAIAVYAHATLAAKVHRNEADIVQIRQHNDDTNKTINNIELNLVRLFAKLDIEYRQK